MGAKVILSVNSSPLCTHASEVLFHHLQMRERGAVSQWEHIVSSARESLVLGAAQCCAACLAASPTPIHQATV